MHDVAAQLEQTYTATAGSVAKARTAVSRFAASAGASELQLQSIRLAVSEAVTNAVLHGHRGAPGDVRVAAQVSGRSLAIVVRDDGIGIGAPSGRSGMGIGLAVIAEVADHMAVAPLPAGGTEVRMRFELTDAPRYDAMAAQRPGADPRPAAA